MITKLNRESQARARRQVLGDVVWALSNGALRRLYQEGRTSLAPIEVYVSAQRFAETLLSLSDAEEGIDYEMDDLEAEAERENDAMLVMVVAAALMEARSKRQVGTSPRTMIRRIYDRWCDHELLIPLMEEMSAKEEARWLEGKRTSLLDYELRQIDLEGGKQEAIEELFDDLIACAEEMDASSIRGLLLALNRYNLDHQHAYDARIEALYEKLSIVSKSNVNGDMVMQKNVVNEVNGVAPGAAGIVVSSPSAGAKKNEDGK